MLTVRHTILRLLACIVFVLLSMAWATARLDPSVHPLRMLCIGINKYPGNSLAFAVQDATDFASAMQEHAGRFSAVSTSLLLDEKATRAGILGALAVIAKEAQTEDTFVLYFAGIGML